MEYYLAVRMRRYGRSLQAQEASAAPERSTDHRMARPTPARSMGAAASVTPVGVGFGSIRQVSRSGGREPGRY